MTLEIPVIDISPLLHSTETGVQDVSRQIGQASRETGFFYIVGHGVDQTRLDDLFAASRQFFALSNEKKNRISVKKLGNNRGYVGIGVERLDTTSLPDHKEAFNYSPNEANGLDGWPDIPGWQELMERYFQTCLTLGAALHRAFAIDLGTNENFFEDKFKKPLATLRLLRYPFRNINDRGETQASSNAPGAGAHTDYGNVTILAVDGVSGLQVLPRGGAWIDAPVIPGSFICNIGDCLMRWSNDVYVSTPHRVIRPVAERYSIAFFLDPDADAIVSPIFDPTNETAHYPPISGYDYLQERLSATYGHKS